MYEFPLKSMPEGAWLDVWVSLPEDTNFGSAGGLCGQGEGSPKCKGRPRIPNAKCDESDCLPVWPDDAIFSPADLKEMESLYFYNKSSTRTADRAFCEGTGNDEATCENGGILTTGKCVEYMNEDECKAKAKALNFPPVGLDFPPGIRLL